MSRLEEELRAYLRKGYYPFHMPGHKRRNLTGAELNYAMDFTELPATDDLHEAEGILREAMERTAELYGAERSWYLVNGSTCGNLAGLFSCTHQGGEIIAARNCHRSIFHGIQLRGLKVHWLLPDYDAEYEIYGSIPVERLSGLLEKYPKTEAVILTSPSYEGVVSDIRSISELCHAHGIPLMVDEAHGAHFSVESYQNYRGEEAVIESTENAASAVNVASKSSIAFPESAICLGADIVVQSPHKTLPSLTQTAWMHLKSSLVKPETVEKMLGIFETSSPSYPLMISLDSCTELLVNRGAELFKLWHRELLEFYKSIADLKHFSVLYSGEEESKIQGESEDGRAPDIEGASQRLGKDDIGSELGEIAELRGTEKSSKILQAEEREINLASGRLDFAKSLGQPEDWEKRRKRAVLSSHPSFYDFDSSKILIHVGDSGLSGAELSGLLRERFGLEMEMSSRNTVLAMTALSDDTEAYRRLSDALHRLDIECESAKIREVQKKGASQKKGISTTALRDRRDEQGENHLSTRLPEIVCTILEATEAKKESIALSESAGRISGEYLYLYPPGIPILIPGERISEELLHFMASLQEEGIRVHFTESGSQSKEIQVLSGCS